MALNPQIAFFAALLTALGGPAQASSREESETPELRKAQISVHQLIGGRSHPESPHPSDCGFEVDVLPRALLEVI